MKIIVAAPPIPGETLPLLQLAGALAERGHRVTVLAGSAFQTAAEAAGLAFVPLSGAADYDVATFAGAREQAALPPGPAQLNYDWRHAFIDPMPDEHRALQELLDRDPDSVLVCNALFLGALPVRQGAPGRRPARWVGVSVVPLALSSDDTTFMGPVPVAPGDDQRAANRAANAGFAAATQPSLDRLNELLRETGAAELTGSFTDTVVTAPDATAVLSVPGFEFHRDDLPKTVHLVGVLPSRSTADWEPPTWWETIPEGRPIVVVTQGTLANTDLGQLIEPALTGLAGLDVTVVAALGDSTAELSVPVPGNAYVERFVPFDRLLPRAAVLVTNGGAGGVHQALAAGVPVVVAGETEDKPANAARVAHHRLGADLGTATPSAEAVAEAVRTLLTDEEIRGNVRRIADVYAAHDAVDRIERLITEG